MKTPRPKHNDDAIIRIAAEKLLPEVMGWLGDAGIPENEVLDDLAKAMRWGSDGYKIAKDLDCYEPDAALVEILDAAGSLKSAAREKACAEWVIANGLEGPELGAKVTSTTRPADGLGTVTRNWPDGRSTVAFHSAGHVTEGVRLGAQLAERLGGGSRA